MSKQRRTVTKDADAIVEHAQDLLTATADVTGEKVSQARKSLSEALDCGKELYGRARDRASDGIDAGDKFMRNNPYAALGIGVGVGVLVGLFLSMRNSD